MVDVASSEHLQQLGAVVERLPIGVVMFDKKRLEVVYANRSARRLLRPKSILRGQPLPEPWPSFSLREYGERLIRPGVALDLRVQVAEDRVYAISGVTPRDTNTATILIEDVSKHERKERAEREFVSNAAHELLTPLTGIVSAAHVLEAGAKDDPETREQFIGHIARECSRLSRIARSLLVLARAQSGEEPPRLEIIPLRGALEEVVEIAGATCTVSCDENVTVLADFDLFTQAASNLLTNAARHGSGAALSITASRVGEGLVQIEITDGGGRADMKELRQRFRSAAGRDGEGFGLGLSIAEQSLAVIGGRLQLTRDGAHIELPGGDFATAE